MKLLVTLFITFLFLTSGSCNKNPLVEEFYTITIDNESRKSIYFYPYDMFSAIQYPDTTLPSIDPRATILGANARFYIDKREPWIKEFNMLVADTLSIFIFDSEVYENADWSEIRDDYNILKRYDLSLEDLEQIDFTVTYPPDASMQGVKMYPR